MLRKSLSILEKLVVVESPNKVIKVEGLLSNAKVIPDWSFHEPALREISVGAERALAMATTGHFMSLKEITWTPQPLKSKPVDNNDFPQNGVLAAFALEWEIQPGRRIQDTITHYIKDKTNNISEIIIATDPDREGELIAVHALKLIRQMFPRLKVPFTRAYIHSITEEGIRTAMQERTRVFDNDLANAAEARHAMDRIFGYLGSSVVRYANPQMRSIGRVQTPALILIHDREQKIKRFMQTHKVHYEIRSLCHFPGKQGLSYAQVVSIWPINKDYVKNNNNNNNNNKINWENEQEVRKMAFEWHLNEAHEFRVCEGPSIQPSTTMPPEPFTMATLIARANRQLHLSSESVSSCLQDLFQLGHITYPRTDSTRIDESAISSIAEVIRKDYGKSMLTKNLNKYKRAREDNADSSNSTNNNNSNNSNKNDKSHKMGNVEDAHEAIRPTNINVEAQHLGNVATPTKQVYELVRQNTLAAFMTSMKTERVSVWVSFKSGNDTELKVQLSGKHVVEPGWSLAFRPSLHSNGNTSTAKDSCTHNDNAMKMIFVDEIESDNDEIRAQSFIPNITNEEFTALVNLKETLQRKSGHVSPAMSKVRAKSVVESDDAQQMHLESWQIVENKPNPPLPFSEGGLIEELKNNGVGRPSTYPMIVKTLLSRNYITVNQGRCETTPIGRMLVETSKATFPSIVNIGFTSQFEKKLDRIAKPELADNAFLSEYNNLTEADYVLSSFVCKFLNYVTEATRNQRATITARSFAIKREHEIEQQRKRKEEELQQEEQQGEPQVDKLSTSTSNKVDTTLTHTSHLTSKIADIVEDEKSFTEKVEKEKTKAAALVPDLLDQSKNYRTFTALQNSLTDYLRRNFPQFAPVTWQTFSANASGNSNDQHATSSSSSSLLFTNNQNSSSGSGNTTLRVPRLNKNLGRYKSFTKYSKSRAIAERKTSGKSTSKRISPSSSTTTGTSKNKTSISKSKKISNSKK